MSHYYELIAEHPDKNEHLPQSITVVFEDFDEAVVYAEEHNIEYITEIGGSWDEVKKCWWCEEWTPSSDMNTNDLCYTCESYLKSRC